MKFPAILLLDRPKQPARLVQADIVRPAVQGAEALLAAPAAAAAIARAIRAGLCHAMRMNKGP